MSRLLHIRRATPDDAPAIARIYNHYITETVITFEEDALPDAAMRARIEAHSTEWLVAVQPDAEAPCAYAYASPWKARAAYRHSVELAVYVDPSCPRRGVGSALYSTLFTMLRERGVHAVIAGIALPNDASVALHERFGMKKVAHFEQTGFKFGQWIDVGYWQRLLSNPNRAADPST